MRRLAALLAALVLVVPLAGCVQEDDDRRSGSPAQLLNPPDPPEVQAKQLAGIKPGKLKPLRAGERRMTLTMPTEYTPSSPTAIGKSRRSC